MDTNTLTQAALGLGIIAAGMWNGLETYRTKRLTRELAKPVHETHRQVSLNRHVSNPPTLLDKVDSMQQEQARVARELRAAGRMFDGHLAASAEDRDALWAHVHVLEQLVGIPPRHPDERRSPDEQPDL